MRRFEELIRPKTIEFVDATVDKLKQFKFRVKEQDPIDGGWITYMEKIVEDGGRLRLALLVHDDLQPHEHPDDVNHIEALRLYMRDCALGGLSEDLKLRLTQEQ